MTHTDDNVKRQDYVYGGEYSSTWQNTILGVRMRQTKDKVLQWNLSITST